MGRLWLIRGDPVGLKVLGERRIQVGSCIAGGKAGEIFDLGRERELAERDGALLPVVLGDRPFEDQWLEISTSGINGGGPASGARTDNNDFFHSFGHEIPHNVIGQKIASLAGNLRIRSLLFRDGNR